MLRLAKCDLGAVGALQKAAIAGLAAGGCIKAGLIQLDASVFVNGGNDRFAGRKIEVVTIKGIDWH
jgi:hypothetical protein